MSFAESLKKYMTDIPCSASELSAVSGLAPSMISRYLRSEQLPGEKAVRKLAAGLDFLSRDKGGPSLDINTVTQSLTESLYGISIDYSLFVKNLQNLLTGLNINNNELAKSLNFDPSYISRILAGTRKPANLYQFLTNVSDYITNRFFDTPYVSVIADITECDVKELQAKDLLSFTVRRYLGSHTDPASDIVPRFLVKLDTFDMNEYRESEKNSSRLTPPGIKLPPSGYYYGLKGLIQSCHDFLDLTAASRTAGDVMMFRDIPPGEISQTAGFSPEFSEKMLRLTGKGFFVHSIIDVHRSFSELLNDLYQWLPYYMSGKVRPYYFPEPTNHTLMHYLCSSGVACVEGGAVFNNPNGARCALSVNLQDIGYAKERAADLLSHAQPLMDIYDHTRKEEYSRDKRAMFISGGDYIMIRTVPPIFAMSASLLNRILARTELSDHEKDTVLSYYRRIKEVFEEIVAKGNLQIDLPESSLGRTVHLSLPGLFLEKRISYSDSEYAEHIRDLKDYAIRHPSVNINFVPENVLKNTEIMIRRGKSVLISKDNDPEIHFTIYYPKLVHAFESYALSYTGDKRERSRHGT